MARAGMDLKGVASFHGSLGAVVPAVKAFKKEMADAGADLTFIAYPGALHSFTNPDADGYAKKSGMAVAYDAEADAKSWEELKGFLATVLK